MDPGESMTRMEEAMRASAGQIVSQRRRLTLEEAAAIVMHEFAVRGRSPRPDRARKVAYDVLHPGWPVLHPIKAHREGWRLGWPWSRGDG